MVADRAKVTRLLKTARGQIDGILKMVEEDKYCMDISNQLMASQGILSKANKEILKAHIESCVRYSFESGNKEDLDEKLEEIKVILDKLGK